MILRHSNLTGLMTLAVQVCLLAYLTNHLSVPAGEAPVVWAADEPQAEPPFPQLTDWRRRKIKIVSEAVDDKMGVQTTEEYHDLELLKSAYYTTNPGARSQAGVASAAADYQVKYLDISEQLSYEYQPYSCKVSKISDLPAGLTNGDEWNFHFEVIRKSRNFKYFGVYGLWVFANIQFRTFARAQFIYSASKDIYRESLLWTVRDEEHKMDIKFFFIDHKRDRQSKTSTAPPAATATKADEGPTDEGEEEPTLEMIQIEVDDSERKDGKRLIRTINILAIQHELSEEIYTEMFEAPVGFGCFSTLVEEGDAALVAARKRDSSKWINWAQRSIHIEFEATATRYELTRTQSGGVREERRSDTYSVELAQSKLKGLVDSDFIELVRWRNTREDKKVVINHLLKVVYALDMRQGTCAMSHFVVGSERQQQQQQQAGQIEGIESQVSSIEVNKTQADRTDELYEVVMLRFKNSGLELDASVRLLKDPDDLHFVKFTPASPRQPEMHYFEGGSLDALKPLESPTAHGGVKRRVRTILSYIKRGPQLNLHSLTIWVLNEAQDRILESYQLTVIEARELAPGWPDEPKLFDVSEECYLESERMHQGRDYAWFELTYPAPSRALAVLSSNAIELKRSFYESVVLTDFSHMPRLEVVFEDDSFIVRMLALDLPPTELIYDKHVGEALMPVPEMGDLSYLAPDLEHCGRFCRMNQCTVMTFCRPTSACLLSSRRPFSLTPAASKLIKRSSADSSADDNSGDVNAKETVFAYANNKDCDTYRMPASVLRNDLVRRNSLHATIARLQHQNYGLLTKLPKVPDELALPQSETGLSDRDFSQALEEYRASLDKHLEKDQRAPELIMSALISGHYFVLVPSKFELESDPMREFNLYNEGSDDGSDEQQLDDNRVPRFHQGLAGFRYDLGAPKALDREARDRVSFRHFAGLTYDQCAMACADSKCGSFSFCRAAGGGDCILSNIETTGKARRLEVIQQDSECFLAQRDFLANFIKFEQVFRPQTYARTSAAGDASECALECVAQTNFKCLAFEYCDKSILSASASSAKSGPPSGQCYFQTGRHLPGLQANGAPATDAKQTPVRPSEGSICDHYSRSQLADFVRLEFRKVSEQVLDQLKTSSFNGLSVFDCAEKCASELIDCTAFQFCHRNQAAKTAPRDARECITIESKVTPKLLTTISNNNSSSGTTNKADKEQLETVVDEQADGQLLSAGSYLEFDDQCQLFSLAKDTSEAHLRDLAFGGLIKTKREKEAEEEAAAAARSSSLGAGLSFFGGLCLYLAVALVSAGLGCGVIILKDNSAHLRQRLDHLKIRLGL